MPYEYAYQGEKQVAKAVARDVAISSKAAIMIANFIRHKPVARVQRELAAVIEKKTAIPYTRFTEGAGHKPGIGPGKYPVKAAKQFLTIVNSCAANARDLGLGEDLRIESVTTHQAARSMRYGRKRGQQRKASHIEVIVSAMETSRGASKTKSAKADTKPKTEKKTAKPAKTKETSEAKDESAKTTEKKSAPAKEQVEKKEAPVDAPADAKKSDTKTPAPKDPKADIKPKTEDSN